MFKQFLARLVRSRRFQSLIAKASSVGSAAPLSRPDAAMFGEGSDAVRRISELEAERDVMAQQMIALRSRIAELERRPQPPAKR
jgi:hypothetical protein